MSSLDFEFIRSLVQKNSAIILETNKTYLAETRLMTLARKESFDSVAALIQVLRTGNTRLQRLVIEAMTTNETLFFRDIFPFEAIRTRILPKLIEERASVKRLQIWSAACSTGQEPYSLAMLIREYFPQLHTWDVQILATDLSTEVLDRARKGVFEQLEVNRGLPPVMQHKYFQRSQSSWQINPEIRRMVEFRPMNLIEPWSHMTTRDIIMMRNVLIYFDVQIKKQILGNVRRVLHPDGYLFLGSAESTINLDENFKRVQFDRTSAYQIVKPAK